MSSLTPPTKGGSNKMPKPNNIIVVPTSLGTDFFRKWCIFLLPFVKLTQKEILVVSAFLKQRWELSQKITDPIIVDSQLMSNETKEKVLEDCGLSLSHFYVVMSGLRKKKVIVNNHFNPRLFPNIRKDDNGMFQLLILFKDNQAHAV